MEFSIHSSQQERKPAEALVLPYFEGQDKPTPAFSLEGLDKELLSLLEKDGKGEASEILFSYVKDGLEKRVVFLGLGKKESLSLETLRHVFASLTIFCRKKKLSSLNVALPSCFDQEQFLAAVDGLLMANYSFDHLKRESLEKKPSFFLKEVTFLGPFGEEHIALISRHKSLMASVNLVRDLVNANADDVRASRFVEIAQELTKKHSSIQCQVLGKKELEQEKMGLLLAVNQGSHSDPALIVLTYQGDVNSQDTTAIIGKGITFDTGGLNLKPSGSIETMRTDMAGAAAVLGVFEALAALKVKKNVIGVISAAENAISDKAYKPGDVYISHSGKSVEITNTDAEGRLVLADAFSYVQKHHKVSRMIDLATLTGGIIVALGEEASGLFSNDEKLAKGLQKAAESTGEKLWQMPLYPEYRKMLNSSLADLKNCAAGRKASSCTAAAFLQEFVKKDMPWAHLDIAGTAYLSDTSCYQPSFATGVGVKLLISFLEDL